MQLIDGQPVFSATDLVGYLECEHLTALERAAMAGLVARPHINDPELDVLRRRGEQHEQRYLAELTGEGRSMAKIALDGSIEDRGEQLRAAADETERAMASGADVIFQATFFDGTWRGHADFLLRTNSATRPSVWGPYHYEVADTKLARHVKAGAVLQICTYVTMLTAIQGVEPEWLHVVLGGSAGGLRTLRVADYMAYYRAARARFDGVVGHSAPTPVYPPTGSYPEPVEHCGVCRWRVACGDRRRDDDHLSLVASISRRQRRALEDRSVHTLAELAVLPLPVEPPLAGTSRPAAERVREQARIQLEGRNRNETIYELFGAPGEAPEPGIGLAGLPPPSPGDLFFDIEGDPYAADDGLDYLFGVSDVDGRFTAIWSRDAAGDFTLDGEKVAFELLMDLFMDRLAAFPDAHIFHFAPYEPTSLKRMMGRHATREDEVDRLLRGDVLVDLYRIVKQSLRASVESYSIKKLEALYDFERVVNLRDAGSSIVVFEEWLQLGDTNRPGADHLDRIEAYNRDDVDSNQRLRDWLESRRRQLAQQIGVAVPRPGPAEPDPSPEQTANQAKVMALVDRLTADVPEEGRTPDQQARWLLAQLLGWHRRENKSFWWQYFTMRDDMTDADRIDATEPIGGLAFLEEVDEEGRPVRHRYGFPEQEYEIKVGTEVHDPATGKSAGEVMDIDEARRTIDLKRGKKGLAPHPTALIPYEFVPSAAQEAALMRLGNWAADHELDDTGPHRAALDMLRRHPPRVGQEVGEWLRGDGETDLTAALRLALELDETVLPIQGPPGSGKTFAGARMALALIEKGSTVGVTANSHRVISNFLRELCGAAEKQGQPISVIQKANKEDGCPHPYVLPTPENKDVDREVATGTHDVVAGTSWLFARPELAGKLDVLFVDEAGQLSLANTLASAQAAHNVVLLGDPQQLDQPLKGSHPPGAERSALGHYLGERATIDPADGLFLETTWRLHPDLCAYTSESFYDDRLEPEPHLVDQIVNGPMPLGGTGPRLVEVAHDHNDNESVEEAEEIARLATSLVEGGATWIDQDRETQPVDWSQIVIVAAYNAQVGAIKTLLPQARVGTVDKFQGQEAPISIYSMASSSVEDAPRGMTFLYSRHRLNVATSRARCVAVVVASPELLRVRARSPEEMRLANALARFAEMAHVIEAPAGLLGGALR